MLILRKHVLMGEDMAKTSSEYGKEIQQYN